MTRRRIAYSTLRSSTAGTDILQDQHCESLTTSRTSWPLHLPTDCLLPTLLDCTSAVESLNHYNANSKRTGTRERSGNLIMGKRFSVAAVDERARAIRLDADIVPLNSTFSTQVNSDQKNASCVFAATQNLLLLFKNASFKYCRLVYRSLVLERGREIRRALHLPQGPVTLQTLRVPRPS